MISGLFLDYLIMIKELGLYIWYRYEYRGFIFVFIGYF